MLVQDTVAQASADGMRATSTHRGLYAQKVLLYSPKHQGVCKYIYIKYFGKAARTQWQNNCGFGTFCFTFFTFFTAEADTV